MIYRCPGCFKTHFTPQCWGCSASENDYLVPLDPAYYSDFHYKSKGFVKDLFGKKKEKAQLDTLLDSVLTKYNQFLSPYFLNFAYLLLDDEDKEGQQDSKEYPQIELFQEVLLRKGFDELKTLPDLLKKLLLTTLFAASYNGFKREVEQYINSDFEFVLRTWIEDSGVDFRNNMCMFLYLIWEHGIFVEDVTFNEDAKQNVEIPLVSNSELHNVQLLAERIYKDILICRLDTKLANFDPDNYVTIHQIDAMDGFEFEDFLVKLYCALGYDVKETKKTADQGADLFVERFGKRVVIQAKNYASNVGNQAVQQVLAAKNFYKCDGAIVVTNSFFTKSAINLAGEVNVKLVNRHNLIELLEDYNHYLIESD